MSFDPDEIVTLPGHGKLTLRTAVERVMAQQPLDSLATIFRQGEPPILELPTIIRLADEWKRGSKSIQSDDDAT